MKKILIIHCIIIAKYLNIYKFIRFLYYKYDDFTNSNILKDNINLYNIHKGKRCFIICSGESLNEFDFLKIKDEISISCSFINYHRNYSDLDLNYYVSIPSHIELYNSHNKSHISKWQINKEKDIEFFYKDVEKGRFTVEPYEYYSKIDCDLGNETILILNSISKSFNFAILHVNLTSEFMHL